MQDCYTDHYDPTIQEGRAYEGQGNCAKRVTRGGGWGSAPEGARRYGPALERTYQFVLWLVPTLDKFPRSQRFLLGDRIEAAARSSAALARSEVQGNLLGE